MLFRFASEWNHQEKAFSYVKKSTNSNFALNLAEMLKKAAIHFYLMNNIFQASLLFNMRQYNILELIDCVNMGKSLEPAKLLF